MGMSATTTASTVDIKDSILDTIGDTPLVRLSRIGAGLTPQIVAKVESFNPGGSIKDRVAVRADRGRRARRPPAPGGTIVEPTSGNTGTGLAIAARLKGYRVIAVMPDKMSQARRSTSCAPTAPRSWSRRPTSRPTRRSPTTASPTA